MKELLQKFCNTDDDSRLSEPWSDGLYSMASDGHIAIRVDRVAEITKGKPFDKEVRWVPELDGEWVDLPEYSLPEMKPCRRCKGTGKISICYECDGDGVICFSNRYHEYEVECLSCSGGGDISGGDHVCKTCNGNGKYFAEKVVEVLFNNHKVNALSLEKIKDLPKIKIFTTPTDGELFHLQFDGGMGVMMGLWNDEGNQS